MTDRKPVTRITQKIRAAVLAVEGAKFNSNREVEVAVLDSDGDIDYVATEAAARRVFDLLGWSGYRAGYGAWIVSRDYASGSTQRSFR